MNTTSQRAATPEQIQSAMEQSVLNGCGAKVEIFMLGDNFWGMQGEPEEVEKAINHLESSHFAKRTGGAYSPSGRAFAGFRTGAVR